MSSNQPGTQLIRADYAPVNGTKLYFEVAGEGNPLVLIHGGLLDRRMWDDQFALFAQHCRVIRYDVRDHGLSKAKCPPNTYADHMDLLGLLDYLGIHQAAIIGLSVGGSIAIDFALAYPGRVSALLPISSAVSGYAVPSEQVTALMNQMSEAWAAGDMENVAEFFQRAWTDGPYRQPAQVDPHVRNRIRTMIAERLKQGPSPGERQPLMPSALHRLAEIRVPTLLVLGELDMPDMFAVSELLLKEIKSVESVIVPGAAHMVNMEQPTLFNQSVLDFLRRTGIIAPNAS